jgi:AcrR family transcriptional regulator
MSEQAAVYEPLSARDRLLAAANELFYEEGVNTVGIDRIIEKAGVAKASLYNIFGSKDALVRAYLLGRHEAHRTRILQQIEALPTARAKLLGIFDEMHDCASQPGFKGCAFVRASAETRAGSCVKAVCEESRAWLMDLLRSLASDIGAGDPDMLARQIMVVYDGAAVAGQMGIHMSGDRSAARLARAVVEQLLP